jgi:hypothetical protein
MVGSTLAPMTASASSDPTWTGKGDGTSWGDSGNWDTMSVPKDGDSVTIGPTSSQPTPHVTGMPGGTELQSLTLSDASLSGGSVTVTTTFSWDVSTRNVATLAAPLTVQGAAFFSPSGQENIKNPVTLPGATAIAGPGVVQVQDTGVAITNSGTLTLAPGATLEANGCCTAPDVLVNTGTISLPPAGSATIGFMDFNDQGSVSAGPGSVLNVIGGPGEFAAGAGISGGGTLRFDQGAAMTLANSVHLGAGSVIGLAGNAKFSGPGSFTGGGKFSWSGGSIKGNLDVASGIATTISGTATKSLTSPTSTHALLAFHGATTVQGSGPVETFGANIANSGTFTVKPGATVEANSCCTTPDQFLNTGTISVPAAKSGKATLGFMDFNDRGSVSAGRGSVLDVIGGPGEFGAGADLSGGGTLQFEQHAAMTLASAVSIGPGTTLVLAGNAKLSGPGSFTGGGKFSWSGGIISGDLDVASGIATTISGPDTKALTSPSTTPTALTLHGTTTLAGPAEVGLNGTTTLANLGTLTMGNGTTISAGTCCTSPDRFTNGGTVTVAAKGSADITNLAFSNSGTVNVGSGALSIDTLSYRQTAGATKLAGGVLIAQKEIDIAGGTLSGSGSITGSVQNAGTVSPSTTTGVLDITGAYQQTSSGVLSSVITGTTPGTKFGQLSVGAQATLAGTLKVSTGNGFTPAHGQTFAILLYHTRSGTFATLTGHPTYTVAYRATAAKVKYP